jgi:hypothetical protein
VEIQLSLDGNLERQPSPTLTFYLLPFYFRKWPSPPS